MMPNSTLHEYSFEFWSIFIPLCDENEVAEACADMGFILQDFSQSAAIKVLSLPSSFDFEQTDFLVAECAGAWLNSSTLNFTDAEIIKCLYSLFLISSRNLPPHGWAACHAMFLSWSLSRGDSHCWPPLLLGLAVVSGWELLDDPDLWRFSTFMAILAKQKFDDADLINTRSFFNQLVCDCSWIDFLTIEKLFRLLQNAKS